MSEKWIFSRTKSEVVKTSGFLSISASINGTSKPKPLWATRTVLRAMAYNNAAPSSGGICTWEVLDTSVL